MTRMRVCTQHGCPVLSTEKRCPEHSRAYEKKRGSSYQRGYDAAHQKERQRIIKAGIQNFACAKCRVQFDNDEPFQLGHTDDRKAWTGPEHIRCNLRAAGVASHAVFERPS